MKKKLQLLLTMMVSLLSAGLIHAQNVPFQVRFTTTTASCYNNGKIVYALTEPDGTVLDALPDGLTQVRIYYRLSASDTNHYSGWYYTGGYDTLTINSGSYIVGVEGLMSNGNNAYTRVDTESVITVATTYVRPEASALTKVADYPYFAGNYPTISCKNSGRVQLLITEGSFPYTVTVCDHATGDTLRTQIFPDFQNYGTSPLESSYQHYYTFDTMPAGIWDFYVVDGCGYGLPKITQEVNTTQLPRLHLLRVCASSGNFADTNVLKINLDFTQGIETYADLFHQYARYRIIYDGLETKEWRPFQLPMTEYYTLYDTVFSAEKYCDIWDRKVTFEFKLEGCDDWLDTISYFYEKPNDLYFEKDTGDVVLAVHDATGSCDILYDWERAYYSIRYYSLVERNSSYSPDYSNYPHEGRPWIFMYHRYHYTHPLTWIYTDIRTGQIIKKDTIGIITDHSFLHLNEVEELYGPLNDTSIAIPLLRQLVDRKGCLLYSTMDTLLFLRNRSRFEPGWEASSVPSITYCCERLDEIIVSACPSPVPIDHKPVTIRLVHSPDRDRYNFEAVYDPETEIWTVTRDNPENAALIEGRFNGLLLSLKDYCLQTGPYWFEVITSCDTYHLVKEFRFKNTIYYDILEEPSSFVTSECGNMYITYTAGRFRRTVISRHLEEDVADTTTEVATTIITIAKAPHNSNTYKNTYYLNSPIMVSMPGEYIFQIAPETYYYNHSCVPIWLRDTVDLGIRTVEFEYAKALLCDSSFTLGNAYVKAINGNKPYTYTLYSRPNRQGEILGSNHTGVFLNVPMRSDQELSCLVTDSCLSYFHVNFYPRTLAALKKVWFDGDMTVSSACEGTTIQVHALSLGDVLQYEWSGPDGFTATTAEPFVHIPRAGSGGWYKVTITYEQCAQVLTDSIYLTVLDVPQVHVTPDATVCPGDTVQVSFVPESPLESAAVNFTVAFENERGITTRSYTAAMGDTVTDLFTTLTDAKIYPVVVDDGRCLTTLTTAVDTAYIRMRTDLLSACNILTTNDMVCYGGDARLTAKSTLETPHKLKWYADYGLTQLLKEDEMEGSDQWSVYDTAAIRQRTVLYVALEAEGQCPMVNGLTTSVMNMQNGTTIVHCGQGIRLNDAGGEDHDYPVPDVVTHHFRSANGRPLAIQFDHFSLSQTSHLQIFTGYEPNTDSLLWDFTDGSWNPGMLLSAGDAFTICFNSGRIPDEGWSAVVECAPGVAMADVRPNHVTVLRDEVCQSQTQPYQDPYGLTPELADIEELNQAVRKSGLYYFSKVYPGEGQHGCDSAVTLELTVHPPVIRDTAVLITYSQGGSFLWHDSLYTQSGHYTARYSLPDGCDSLEMLHLMIIDAQISSNNVCEGERSYMNISLYSQGDVLNTNTIMANARVGDVLCTDGSFLSADSFLLSGKSAKGVVFYVDRSGTHGLAMSLTEASLPLARVMVEDALDTVSLLSDAINDMNGMLNMRRIKNAVEAVANASFDSHAPAVQYCYAYDHNTLQPEMLPLGWYMPSAGEMNILYSRRLDVNKTLRILSEQQGNVTPLTSPGYWTSTMYDRNNAWMLTDKGGYTYNNIDNLYAVRPIIAF